jgi:uncharacterized membrane protein
MISDPPAETEARSGHDMSPGKKLVNTISGIFLFAYPFIIFFLLNRYSTRVASIVLCLVMFFNYGLRLFAHPETFRTLLVQVGGVFLLISGTVVFRNPLYIMHLPVLISLFLLATFSYSLIKPPAVIERYARIIQTDLSDAEVNYCRTVTWVWIFFFVFNILITEWIIILGDLSLWTLYAGFISYMIMGFIFSIEYIIRKLRFQKFSNGILDLVLKRYLGRGSGK